MTRYISAVVRLACIVVITIACLGFYKHKKKKVTIAYVGDFRGPMQTDLIDIGRISHINCAFVDMFWAGSMGQKQYLLQTIYQQFEYEKD